MSLWWVWPVSRDHSVRWNKTFGSLTPKWHAQSWLIPYIWHGQGDSLELTAFFSLKPMIKKKRTLIFSKCSFEYELRLVETNKLTDILVNIIMMGKVSGLEPWVYYSVSRHRNYELGWTYTIDFVLFLSVLLSLYCFFQYWWCKLHAAFAKELVPSLP